MLIEKNDLGQLMSDLSMMGEAGDEVRFRIIGFVNVRDERGFREPVEIDEDAVLYDVSRNANGKVTITLEVE